MDDMGRATRGEPGGSRRETSDLVALYATRTLGRTVEIRAAINERRAIAAAHGGHAPAPRATGRVALLGQPVALGRGTPAHRVAVRRSPVRATRPPRAARASIWTTFVSAMTPRPAPRRRLLTAGLAVLLIAAGASSTLAHQRYEVVPGDTVDGIAATFGVDPAALLAASWVPDPANLQPGAVVVIPDPGQTPEEAAQTAAALEGTSPFVVGAHIVTEGEILDGIAAEHGMDGATLAAFNDLEDPNDIRIGQRLLIPAVRGEEGAEVAVAETPIDEPGTEALTAVDPGQDGEPSAAEVWVAPTEAFVGGVPTYVQQRNLSCEYAAAYIATSAWGAGVPEWMFWDQIPQSLNPHWGYRGNIDGWWGNTDDYGIYAEALAPVLNANGFAADIFYGQGDSAALTARLDAGVPVVVWLGFWGDTAVTLADEGVYTVAAGEHVVVAYGYDQNGVYVSDPATGTYRFFGWGDFLAMWNVLDGMAMGIAPL